MKIKIQKNGLVKAENDLGNVTVTLRPTAIVLAIYDLADLEKTKLAKDPEYSQQTLEDLRFARICGLAALGVDHPVTRQIVKYAANTAAENAF
jgi:hypothetical protein